MSCSDRDENTPWHFNSSNEEELAADEEEAEPEDEADDEAGGD